MLTAGKGSPELPSSQRNAVQYLSIYDNKVLRKFRGHTATITNISASPADDSFLTSSLDRSVRCVPCDFSMRCVVAGTGLYFIAYATNHFQNFLPKDYGTWLRRDVSVN